VGSVSQTQSSGLRQIFLNGALFAFTILIVLGFMEIGLRIAFARSLDFSMEMWKYAVALKHPVPDPHLSFAHIPNGQAFLMGVQVTTNSHGLRDREYTLDKPSDVYRIVMLGDSTMFGWGDPFEQTIPKILERELNSVNHTRYRRFEVLNAGVGNYDTVQEYTHYLTYDRAYHPDLVVLQYYINDAEPVPVERTPGILGHSWLAAFTLSRSDAVTRFAGLRPNWKGYYAGLYRDDQPGFAAAKKALADLAAATRADGVGLLVTILPELHEINADYPFTREQQYIKDVLAANHVPMLDLLDGLRGHGPEISLWITPADSHPNGKANQLIVRQMVPWIVGKLGSESAAGH
jgi:lysophospholipase L1-like esterase